ncbi:MAG: hypothetical protein CMB80_25125 [Flammeovirgaceae bacterium]|nr:hypothetical protein [Flammeovirgaceae bacterium]
MPIVVNSQKFDFKRYFNFLLILFFIQLVINFFVFNDLLSFFLRVYRPQQSGYNWYRFSGTFGFSYMYCHYLILFMAMFFYLHYYTGKKLYYVFYFLTFVVCLASGSRIGIAVACLVYGLLFLTAKNKLSFLLVPVVFVGTMFLMTIYYGFDYTDSAFLQSVIDKVLVLVENGFSGDPSARHRTSELMVAMEIFYENPWFGSGSNKMYFSERLGLHLESLYAYYLGKWGLIGLSVHFVFIAYLIVIANRVARKSEEIFEKSFARGYQIWVLTIIPFGLSISVTDSYRGPFLFYLMSGYIFLLYLQLSNTNKSSISDKEDSIMLN